MVVEVEETVYLVDIETTVCDTVDQLELELSTSEIIEINSDYIANIVFASDVIGLDSYIANFIDTYNIDCGTP